MKKTLSRKLTLQKETLRSLEEPWLREANGGTLVTEDGRTCNSCDNSCDTATRWFCTNRC
jgi:hypothetical protein